MSRASQAPAAGFGSDAEAWPDDAIEVGRIVDAWGIKGWIKVLPYSSDPQALFSSKRWYLRPASDKPRPAGAPALPSLLRVIQAKDHGDVVVASVQDVDGRNAAEALKGAAVFVSRASFPTAAADEFYWIDLLGLSVFNREGLALGKVAELLDTGAHSVLLVREDEPGAVRPAAAEQDPSAEKPSRKPVERLIPFVAAYIDTVDVPGGRITVDWSTDWDAA